MFDLYDVLGISTLLEWGNRIFREKKEQYIQQPLPQKFMYRPETFEEYISQEKAKDKAKLTIELINKGFPRHFLIMGNAGFGKTTLAGIITKTLGFNFCVYVGSNFDIDTLNDFLINNDGTSHEISLMRIAEQLNKELSMLAREAFVGGNLNTSSAVDIQNFTKDYLDLFKK